MDHRPIAPAITPHRNAHLSLDSTLIEKALEYQFAGQVMAGLYRRGHRYEVLHSICDRDGYDIVIEAKGIVRHIQLKTLVEGGKRARISLHTALERKPSGCAIIIGWNMTNLQPGNFRLFGGAPGEQLPALGDRMARHSRGNRDGIKGARPDHREIALGRFERVRGLEELIDRLFGSEPVDTHTMLLEHMARLPNTDMAGWPDRVRDGDFFTIPHDLDWETSAALADLVDGYQLANALGYDNVDQFLQTQKLAATATGAWQGNAAELWVTLFLEHRRQRFDGGVLSSDLVNLLDGLVRQLREALTQ